MKAQVLITTGAVLLAIATMSFRPQTERDSIYSIYHTTHRNSEIHIKTTMADLSQPESNFTEEEQYIESWMTTQFSFKMEVVMESWMTTPFLLEKEVVLESWMTKPFLHEEGIDVESWMTSSWL